jgi:rhodanese-related sulfurtransferase
MDTAFASDFSISPQELAQRLGRADAPLVLDVRKDPKFQEDPRMVCGAVRCAPQDVAAFAATHPPREVVAYCVYGHQVSQEAVATLRAAGWNAKRVAGGILGGEDGVDAPEHIAQWRASRLSTFSKRPNWGVPGAGPSRWITRERPKIDRIACPWLIQRFIDPRAEFFYVPTDQVFAQAKQLNAVAYDIPGAPVSHEGELCSFDAFVQGFGLKDPALARLADIVRAADTDHLGHAPQAAGLLAVSLGMSHNYADDHAMLAAMLPVYDALYAWCRDAVKGTNERHNWKST